MTAWATDYNVIALQLLQLLQLKSIDYKGNVYFYIIYIL